MAIPVFIAIATALLLSVNVLGCNASNNSTLLTCKGYLVVGAGSASVDGCYTEHGFYENRPLYILDNSNQLYAYQGTWKLGLNGHNVSYHAAFMSNYPPESLGGCGTWSPTLGKGPCPAVHRVGLPPGPPLPPPPPPPPLAPSPPPPPMHLVFEDDFIGDTINTSKWVVRDKELDQGGMWMKDNVVVANGALVLRAVAQNYSAIVDGVNVSFFVSGAGISTQGLFEQHTGRWEASVKMPRPNEAPSYTLHSSIWLNSGYAVNSTSESGCGQEIDIIEQYTGPQPPNPTSYGVGSLHAMRGHCTAPGANRPGCSHITPIHTGSASARDRGDEIWSW
eukprot:m.156277 g.156277  ORF g.156277 m.156277 type:complete len:335 (-) comp30983_c0_seq1:328-1332(-)